MSSAEAAVLSRSGSPFSQQEANRERLPNLLPGSGSFTPWVSLVPGVPCQGEESLLSACLVGRYKEEKMVFFF